MGLKNIIKKFSTFNNERKEKKLNNLKVKAATAKVESKKIKEEIKLRKDIEQHKILKKKLNEEKMKKFQNIIKSNSNSTSKKKTLPNIFNENQVQTSKRKKTIKNNKKLKSKKPQKATKKKNLPDIFGNGGGGFKL